MSLPIIVNDIAGSMKNVRQGNLIISGNKTFAQPLTISAAANQLVLSNTTINAPSATVRTYNVPDVGPSSIDIELGTRRTLGPIGDSPTPILATDSGIIIFLANSSGVTGSLTLPPPSSGTNYKFVVVSTFTPGSVVELVSPDPGTMFGFVLDGLYTASVNDNSIGRDRLQIRPGVLPMLGDTFDLVSDGSKWFVTGFQRDALNTTFA